MAFHFLRFDPCCYVCHLTRLLQGYNQKVSHITSSTHKHITTLSIMPAHSLLRMYPLPQTDVESHFNGTSIRSSIWNFTFFLHIAVTADVYVHTAGTVIIMSLENHFGVLFPVLSAESTKYPTVNGMRFCLCEYAEDQELYVPNPLICVHWSIMDLEFATAFVATWHFVYRSRWRQCNRWLLILRIYSLLIFFPTIYRRAVESDEIFLWEFLYSLLTNALRALWILASSPLFPISVLVIDA